MRQLKAAFLIAFALSTVCPQAHAGEGCFFDYFKKLWGRSAVPSLGILETRRFLNDYESVLKWRAENRGRPGFEQNKIPVRWMGEADETLGWMEKIMEARRGFHAARFRELTAIIHDEVTRTGRFDNNLYFEATLAFLRSMSGRARFFDSDSRERLLARYRQMREREDVLFIPSAKTLGLGEINELSAEMLYPVGVVASVTRADTYKMTPLDFFFHDLGHWTDADTAGMAFYTFGTSREIRRRMYAEISHQFRGGTPRREDLFELVWFHLTHEIDPKLTSPDHLLYFSKAQRSNTAVNLLYDIGRGKYDGTVIGVRSIERNEINQILDEISASLESRFGAHPKY